MAAYRSPLSVDIFADEEQEDVIVDVVGEGHVEDHVEDSEEEIVVVEEPEEFGENDEDAPWVEIPIDDELFNDDNYSEPDYSSPPRRFISAFSQSRSSTAAGTLSPQDWTSSRPVSVLPAAAPEAVLFNQMPVPALPLIPNMEVPTVPIFPLVGLPVWPHPLNFNAINEPTTSRPLIPIQLQIHPLLAGLEPPQAFMVPVPEGSGQLPTYVYCYSMTQRTHMSKDGIMYDITPQMKQAETLLIARGQLRYTTPIGQLRMDCLQQVRNETNGGKPLAKEQEEAWLSIIDAGIANPMVWKLLTTEQIDKLVRPARSRDDQEPMAKRVKIEEPEEEEVEVDVTAAFDATVYQDRVIKQEPIDDYE